jgi:hypothetical protein
MTAAPSAAAESEIRTKSGPSGRLLLRMPAPLHAELARRAEGEGVSLNQFITSTLSRRIGWGDEGQAGAADTGAPAPPRHSRLIAAALVANVIVIGLAAVAAIAILVLAWQG